jgi:hypothetical protein
MASGNQLLQHQAGQLHGEIKTQDVTVSGGPSLLPDPPLQGRKFVHITNKTGGTIWLGGSGVAWWAGTEVADDGTFSLNLGRSQLYATTTSATVSGVRVMEIA